MSRVRCRVCRYPVHIEEGKRGRPNATHSECDAVVEEHILSKKKRAPKVPLANWPQTPAPKSSGTAQPAPSCDFCGWTHETGRERAECRARAERANRDIADLRKRRVQ